MKNKLSMVLYNINLLKEKYNQAMSPHPIIIIIIMTPIEGENKINSKNS